jgi:hypothetical protein
MRDELDPPTPEEREAASELHRALAGGPCSEETAALARTARLIASVAPAPPGDLALERVRRRVEERLRARPRRLAWGVAALAAAAGIAATVLVLRPPGPALPYSRLFTRPFESESRPLERIERILAWRRGGAP